MSEGRAWIGQYRTLAGKWNLRTTPPPPDIPLANLFSVDVPSPSQAPSDSPANLRGEMGSGQRQALKEVPAVAVEMAPPVVTKSSEAASYPLR